MCQSTTSQRRPELAAGDSAQGYSRKAVMPAETDAFCAAFMPHPTSVGSMRDSTTGFLRRFGLASQLVGSIVLVVSELVTNAIEHGHGLVELKIHAVDGTITVSVTDENPAPAVLKQANPDDISGRGMALVAAYSDKWGSGGEETWCEFRAGSAA